MVQIKRKRILRFQFPLLLATFFLVNQSDLVDRIIRLAGPGDVSITTRALSEAAQGVSRYLSTQALVNGSYGVALSTGLLLLGVGLFGIAGGTFLAVDWALITDLVLKASSGRYMGISNVATATAGIFAVMTGGLLMDATNAAMGYGSGPRFALGLAVFYYVLGALLHRPVVEPRTQREHVPVAA